MPLAVQQNMIHCFAPWCQMNKTLTLVHELERFVLLLYYNTPLEFQEESARFTHQSTPRGGRGGGITCNTGLETNTFIRRYTEIASRGPTWCSELTASECGGLVFRSAYRWREHLKWRIWTFSSRAYTQQCIRKHSYYFNYIMSCSSP